MSITCSEGVIFWWVAGSEVLRRPSLTKNWVVEDSDPATQKTHSLSASAK